MDHYKLKSLIREYICKTGLSFPSYSERVKMYREYKEMLATAPVADEPSTFKQYLDWYFNSKKSVNKYE